MKTPDTITRLIKLNKEKQLTFGLLAAERFFICYKIFSQREGFGDVVCLLESMSLIEDFIVGKDVDVKQVEKYKNLVDENLPDIDDFGSTNSSLALNVGAIIYEGLNFILKEEERIPKEFLTYAMDSIDIIVFEIEKNEQMKEDEILNHPLMKEELELQNGIVSYLEKMSEIEMEDIQTLRQFQQETRFGKLKLSKIFAK